MGLTIKQLEESGALQELKNVFTTRDDALAVLGNVPGLERARLPEFNRSTPSNFWDDVVRQLEQGAVEKGLEALMAAAARLYHGNEKFRAYASSGSEGTSRTIVIEIHADELDEEVLALFRQAQRLARGRGGIAKLDVITRGSIRLHVSLEDMSPEEADALAHELQRTLPASAQARVYREDHTFRDYLMDPLYAEGPDGQRFELDHVRASTRVGDLAQGVVSQYDDAFWPTDNSTGKHASPTVDVRHPDGEVRRLQSNQTLHEAGVRPRDTLSVFPERRAGINFFLLAEALTVVRNQILDFARMHPGFFVEANSTELPTEYLLRFRAPGFAPGSPPRRIDQHEVLLYFPPEFPVSPPKAYWQNDLFHPNVHAASGLVCLGVLADSYRPGLHIGTLCQMLIDMASFQNYALDEGYNKDAASWAESAEGQRAILAIGGHSSQEVRGEDERPIRRVNIRKVGP